MRSFLLHTLWISLFLMLSSMAQATSNCTPTVCPYTVSEQAKQPLNQHVLMFEAPSDWTIEQVHEAYLNQQFRPALGHRIQTLQRQHKAAVADAQLDPLTDILNRRGLDHAFQRIVQNGKGEVALHIDTCVGIAQSPVASADYNALYRQADQALYQQKQALKNTQLTAVNEANA